MGKEGELANCETEWWLRHNVLVDTIIEVFCDEMARARVTFDHLQ